MQVVDDLKTEILPQAKELLKLVERQAGTTVPTSFKEVGLAGCAVMQL